MPLTLYWKGPDHVLGSHLKLSIICRTRETVSSLLDSTFCKSTHLVVLVREPRGADDPGTVVSTSVGVASSESVGSREGYDLAVVEAHAVEDVSEVLRSLGRVGKSSLGRAL